MLLYQFISDTCNDAGFFEINFDRMCEQLKFEEKRMRATLNGIRKFYIISDDKTSLFFRPFLNQQRKLPLNAENSAHTEIIAVIRERLFQFKGNESGINIITSLLPSNYGEVMNTKNDALPEIPEDGPQDTTKPSLAQTSIQAEGFPETPVDNSKHRKKRFVEPSLKEVEDCFLQQISSNETLKDIVNYKEVALEFYRHYTGNGWRLKHGSDKKMSDWEAVVRTWCTKRETAILFEKKQYDNSGRKGHSKSRVIMESMKDAANTDWNTILDQHN